VNASSSERDPMARVLGLDAATSTVGAWCGFGSGGFALFGGLVAVLGTIAWLHARGAVRFAPLQEIEVTSEETPRPSAPPAAEPEKAAPPAPRAFPKEPPPASPAPAARVLSAEPTRAPVDLTNMFAQGDADRYAGKFTSTDGTGTGEGPHEPYPLRGVASASPPPAREIVRATDTEDGARVAALSGGTEWSCPFPAEADASETDEAFVPLVVEVAPDGRATSARVLKEPGHGFGREAQRCAMTKRYVAALDHEGSAVPGATKPFRVHFTR
jgi:periplasmic protein TonB